MRVCARVCVWWRCGCGDVWRRVCGGVCVAAAVGAVCVCVRVLFFASPIYPAREGDRDRVERIAEFAVAAVMVAVVVLVACVCVCVCVCGCGGVW